MKAIDKKDVVVVGAGPAGLFGAITLAQKFHGQICMIERNSIPGRKLLLTGGGQCNFTHEGSIEEFIKHYGENGKFLKPAFKAFFNRDLIQFFKSRKIYERVDENGRVIPCSGRAQDILDVLVQEARNQHIELQTSVPVLSLTKNITGIFEVHTRHESIQAKALLIATGGKSYPQTGSRGDGYAWAKALGHEVTPLRPALAPLFCKNPGVGDLAGVSLWGSRVSLWRQGHRIYSVPGDILFTHRGVSGPAIQDISRQVEEDDCITLQLLVNTSRQEAEQRMTSLWSSAGAKVLRTVLCDLGLSQRLADCVLAKLQLPPSQKVARTGKKQRQSILDLLWDFPLVISERGGFEIAMVTQGGVALSQVNSKTMGSKLVSGLFFAGEVLDLDGDCGGYNLQAAFSTGYLAAHGIEKFLIQQR